LTEEEAKVVVSPVVEEVPEQVEVAAEENLLD